jgi:hypothetical protein
MLQWQSSGQGHDATRERRWRQWGTSRRRNSCHRSGCACTTEIHRRSRTGAIRNTLERAARNGKPSKTPCVAAPPSPRRRVAERRRNLRSMNMRSPNDPGQAWSPGFPALLAAIHQSRYDAWSAGATASSRGRVVDRPPVLRLGRLMGRAVEKLEKAGFAWPGGRSGVDGNAIARRTGRRESSR